MCWDVPVRRKITTKRDVSSEFAKKQKFVKIIYLISSRDSELIGKRRSSIGLSNDPGSDSSGESPEPEKEKESGTKLAKSDSEPPSPQPPSERKVKSQAAADLIRIDLIDQLLLS